MKRLQKYLVSAALLHAAGISAGALRHPLGHEASLLLETCSGKTADGALSVKPGARSVQFARETLVSEALKKSDGGALDAGRFLISSECIDALAEGKPAYPIRAQEAYSGYKDSFGISLAEGNDVLKAAATAGLGMPLVRSSDARISDALLDSVGSEGQKAMLLFSVVHDSGATGGGDVWLSRPAGDAGNARAIYRSGGDKFDLVSGDKAPEAHDGKPDDIVRDYASRHGIEPGGGFGSGWAFPLALGLFGLALAAVPSKTREAGSLEKRDMSQKRIALKHKAFCDLEAGTFRLGEFLINANLIDAQEDGRTFDADDAMARYNALLDSLRKEIGRDLNVPKAVPEVLGRMNYRLSKRTISDALFAGGGNCEALSQLVAALAYDAGKKDVMLVSYSTHLAPVIYHRFVMRDLVSGMEKCAGGRTFSAAGLVEIYRVHGGGFDYPPCRDKFPGSMFPFWIGGIGRYRNTRINMSEVDLWNKTIADSIALSLVIAGMAFHPHIPLKAQAALPHIRIQQAPSVVGRVDSPEDIIMRGVYGTGFVSGIISPKAMMGIQFASRGYTWDGALRGDNWDGYSWAYAGDKAVLDCGAGKEARKKQADIIPIEVEEIRAEEKKPESRELEAVQLVAEAAENVSKLTGRKELTDYGRAELYGMIAEMNGFLAQKLGELGKPHAAGSADRRRKTAEEGGRRALSRWHLDERRLAEFWKKHFEWTEAPRANSLSWRSGGTHMLALGGMGEDMFFNSVKAVPYMLIPLLLAEKTNPKAREHFMRMGYNERYQLVRNLPNGVELKMEGDVAEVCRAFMAYNKLQGTWTGTFPQVIGAVRKELAARGLDSGWEAPFVSRISWQVWMKSASANPTNLLWVERGVITEDNDCRARSAYEKGLSGWADGSPSMSGWRQAEGQSYFFSNTYLDEYREDYRVTVKQLDDLLSTPYDCDPDWKPKKHEY
ncbi:hypothetical protein L0Y65_03750 [Candidatus Micrarchaeota archaeon]|nr:hypothetical protein [Candidatus Micrarchaeota archaeon]